MATSLDELSRAILAWLDQHSDTRPGTPSWNTKDLRTSFRKGLDNVLIGSLEASVSIAVIRYLIEAFQPPVANGRIVIRDRRHIVAMDVPGPESLAGVQSQIRELLAANAPVRDISGVTPSELAGKIVQALRLALKSQPVKPVKPVREASANQENDDLARWPDDASARSPFLQFWRHRLHLWPSQQQNDRRYRSANRKERQYDVRMFLMVFGMVLAAIIVYAIVKPDSWLNPATALFAILGYVTLIATALVHDKKRNVEDI
jgi:hypothetical protein